MTQAALCTMSSGISSVAHNNPHINVIFVYLFMRKLLVDKIPFLKFLYISHQPRLHQLNFTTSSRSSTVQSSLTAWISSFDRGNTIKEGKYPLLRTNTKPHQHIKHANISYSIASPVFRKFSYRTYRNGLNQVRQSWGTPSISKTTNRVSSIPFVTNPHFSILLHRVRYLKNLFMSRR